MPLLLTSIFPVLSGQCGVIAVLWKIGRVCWDGKSGSGSKDRESLIKLALRVADRGVRLDFRVIASDDDIVMMDERCVQRKLEQCQHFKMGIACLDQLLKKFSIPLNKFRLFNNEFKTNCRLKYCVLHYILHCKTRRELLLSFFLCGSYTLNKLCLSHEL